VPTGISVLSTFIYSSLTIIVVTIETSRQTALSGIHGTPLRSTPPDAHYALIIWHTNIVGSNYPSVVKHSSLQTQANACNYRLYNLNHGPPKIMFASTHAHDYSFHLLEIIVVKIVSVKPSRSTHIV
jgi:hypothetical protein